jgi:FMN phosphatase YigB (HAD superfamily)
VAIGVNGHAPALVIFDAGSTLLASRRLTRRRRIAALSPLPAEHVRRYVRDRLLILAEEDFTPELIAQAAAHLGVPVSGFPYQAGETAEPFELAANAREAVAVASSVAWVDVLSNISAFDGPAMETVLREGLTHYLRNVWLSHRMGVSKPDPLTFTACAEVGQVPLERCVMVGDSWDNDIAGALQAGMKAAWLNPFSEPVPTSHRGHPNLMIGPVLPALVVAAVSRWLTPAEATGRPSSARFGNESG